MSLVLIAACASRTKGRAFGTPRIASASERPLIAHACAARHGHQTHLASRQHEHGRTEKRFIRYGSEIGKDLFHLLEEHRTDVEAAIRSVPGLVSYSLVSPPKVVWR